MTENLSNDENQSGITIFHGWNPSITNQKYKIIFGSVYQDRLPEIDLQAIINVFFEKNASKQWYLIPIKCQAYQQNFVLYPFLNLLHRLLRVDNDTLLLNSRLPSVQQLPQVGDLLIPDFFSELPQNLIISIFRMITMEEITQAQFTEMNLNLEDLFQGLIIIFQTLIQNFYQMQNGLIILHQCEWIDDYSTNFFQYLLTDEKKNNLFIFGLYMALEITENWFSLYENMKMMPNCLWIDLNQRIPLSDLMQIQENNSKMFNVNNQIDVHTEILKKKQLEGPSPEAIHIAEESKILFDLLISQGFIVPK